MGFLDFVKGLFSDDDDAGDEDQQARDRMADDRADPRKLFVFGVLCCTEDIDPGYRQEYAKVALADWYSIESGQEILEMGQDYFAAREYPAYNIFRLCFVARAGYGAGMLDEAASWGVCFRHCSELHRTYSSWQAFAQGYVDGHVSYRRHCGDDEATVAGYRDRAQARMQQALNGWWAQIPWNTRLG